MKKFGCGITILLGASLALASQAVEAAKSTYERRGLYHATIHGRFLSHTGEPVAGVHVQLHAGRPRALPLVDVVTGHDGSFAMRDVNSVYTPYLEWYPPEEWVDGWSYIVGESGGEIDVGTIRLQPDTVIRVEVELVGGSPLPPRDREATVILEGVGGVGPRIVAEKVGSEQVLRGISFDDGNWEISLDTNSRSEIYQAPFHVQRGRRDQKFTFRLLRNTAKPASEYQSEGKMQITETLVPPASLVREFRARGRILAPDGSPVEGAIVNVFDIPIHRVMSEWARSSVLGEYELRFRSTKCVTPAISYGDTDYWNLFAEQNATELPCEENLRSPSDLVMPLASRLALHVEGTDSTGVRAYWWHDSFGWQQFSSLWPWIPVGGSRGMPVRVDAPGYLPMIRAVKFPSFDRSKNEIPPPEMALEFKFDATARRNLTVLGRGQPLTGATVDIESIENLDSDERRLLGTYSIPADGRMQLLGSADRMVEVFAYARGFEPRRAIWNAHIPLVLELTALSEALEFPASSSVVLARVRDTASPRAVRTVKLNAARRTLLELAPRGYDVTCYNDRGGVAGYQRLVVTKEAATQVDCSVDQRPRLTVRYPAGGWHVSVSESTPRGGSTGWVAMLAGGSVPGFPEVDATLENESAREAVFLLSHGGRIHIEAREGDRALTLWRDIELAPRQSSTIELPHEWSILKGSMRSYDGGLGRSEHGWAGPRLQLIADDPAGWSVTEYLPERDARVGEPRHRFTLTGLPVGNYHLYQHLIGKPQKYLYQGHTTEYTEPMAAWGGVSVKLEANRTTQLQDFIDYSLKDLQVHVIDTSGRLMEHATLRVRDRMSESWRQVEENPAQLEQAAHPVPYPVAVRISAGNATLPRIREGQLDLSVELDSGEIFSFTVPVSPGRELQLVVPSRRVQ